MAGASVLRVGPPDAGRRIERFLARRLEAAPDHVAKLLRQGRVLADGRPVARGHVLRPGERIELLPAGGAAPPPQPNRRLRLTVLHEDPDLALVAKPPRLAMHPGPGHGTDTLLNGLVGRFPELLELGAARGWGLVHRLDRETSGVLAVARTAPGYDGLRAAFAGRRVRKDYLALLAGAPPPAGELSRPIDGKDAVSRWEVLEQAGPVALVRLQPLTGRTHQLRIHMASLGHPVLADARHGRGLDALTARLYLGRLALHAERLAFEHPLRGGAVEAVQPLPKDLRRAWQRAVRAASGGSGPEGPSDPDHSRPEGSEGVNGPR